MCLDTGWLEAVPVAYYDGPMSCWCVYMLECADGSLYTGMTNDLEQRLASHQEGKGAKYTRARLPVKLVYHEPANNRSAAARREYQIKKLSAAKKRALL